MGWQIPLMGSELDKEAKLTADTWRESNRENSSTSFQECQPNSLPASTSNALSSPHGKKAKCPKHVQADKCPDFGILWRECNGRAFNGNYLGEPAAPRPARVEGDLKLCSAQSSVPAKPEGALLSLGVQWVHRFSLSLVPAPLLHMGHTGKLEEQSQAHG